VFFKISNLKLLLTPEETQNSSVHPSAGSGVGLKRTFQRDI